MEVQSKNKTKNDLNSDLLVLILFVTFSFEINHACIEFFFLQGLLLLLFSSTLLILLPQPTKSAPIPNPAPKPLTPGILIGAKAGALLVLKGMFFFNFTALYINVC